jgi:hypothetical protein
LSCRRQEVDKGGGGLIRWKKREGGERV